MGLDLWLEKKRCKACGHQEISGNFGCTYNLIPMWKLIYPEHEKFIPIDGMTAKKSLVLLEDAVKKLIDNKEECMKLNPKNGWGSYDSFLNFLTTLIKNATENPKAIWRSCR